MFLTDALKIDPNYIAARARLAHCHEIFFRRDGFGEADKTAALRHAHVVTASDTDDATALAVAALVITLLTRERGAALIAIERALALNPSCATALYFGSTMYGFAARPVEAIAAANRALRLSPFDPESFTRIWRLGSRRSWRRATTRRLRIAQRRCRPILNSAISFSFMPRRSPWLDA